jgi:DNA-binding NtrC family response regulator
MAHVLIVDDDEAFRESLVETVAALGHTVTAVGGGRAALRAAEYQRFGAVFLDHRMPDMDSVGVLEGLAARVPRLPPVVVLTAHATSENTIAAMRLGAFDHLTKPIGVADVRDVLARALALHPPGPERVAPASDAGDRPEADALIGVSAPMRDVQKAIGLAAASDAPVLVTGETGTGKERVARALHRHSRRAARPFVAVNCAAIPHELLESELFGHVRGAFTGAVGDRDGCFRAAQGGVLLLDEIGDLSPAVQGKLLRVLEEREVVPLGSHRAVPVDVRVVAATHRDLRAAVRAGTFREDLLFRLDVLQIRLPPLRERLADAIPLAEHFLALAAAPGVAKTLSPAAQRALVAHAWPGNVRELRNAMDRCQAMVRGPVVAAADLGLAPAESGARADDALPASWLDAPMAQSVERLERAMIERALAKSGGNRAEAARRLGIHRQLLYRKLQGTAAPVDDAEPDDAR